MYSCVSRTKNDHLHLCREPGFPNSQKVILFLPPFRKMRAEKFSSWGAMRASCRMCRWCLVLYERNRVVRKRSLARLWPSTTQIGSNMKNTSLFFPTGTDAITWFISLSLSVYNCTISVPFLTHHQATIERSEHSFFLISIYSYSFSNRSAGLLLCWGHLRGFCCCYLSVAVCSSLSPFGFVVFL